jgi:hypothetical protein
MASLGEILNSESYRKIGADYYKSMQLFVVFALIYAFFFEYNGSLLFFIVLSVIWSTFGISLLIALPFFALHAYLVSRGKKKFSDKLLWIGHAFAALATVWLFDYLD